MAFISEWQCCQTPTLSWDEPISSHRCQCGAYWAPVLFRVEDEESRTIRLGLRIVGGLESPGMIRRLSEMFGWTRHKLARKLVKIGLRDPPVPKQKRGSQ